MDVKCIRLVSMRAAAENQISDITTTGGDVTATDDDAEDDRCG